MKITFWQNILSIHQIPLLNALANLNDVEVNLIVCDKIPHYRRNLGWDFEGNFKFNLINLEDVENTENYINFSDFHVFSGFLSYKKLNKIFIKCLNKKNVYIYSEGKDHRGLKGCLRILKDKFNYFIYGSKIKGVFAIGNKGVSWYSKIGFETNKIKKFGYFTYFPNLKKDFYLTGKYIFVGRLIESKGILNILNVFSQESNLKKNIDIYGNGPLEPLVYKFIEKYKNINYLGVINNKELRTKLMDYDCLLLPNTGDEGWGAVVNEALTYGLKVICSENTGSNCLIKASKAGIVLSDVDDLKLQEALVEIEAMDITKDEIFQWSSNYLTPDIGAEYFYSVLKGKEVDLKW